MTESMIVEAVRALRPVSAEQAVAGAPGAPQAVADPAAVERFQAAMGVGGPQAVQAVDPIPFAAKASAALRTAQGNHQDLLHRIRALSSLERLHGPSSGELVELQYEVMNLAFQQEVVTKVADKSSTAIQTLVKNQ